MIGTARAFLAGATIVTGLAASALPAQAQLFGFFGYRPFSYAPPVSESISPQDVRAIVADEGMRLVGRPYRNGNVWVADTIDNRGWTHRLIINAYSGDIVQSFGRGQAVPPRLAAPDAPVPQRQIARAVPDEPYVIPGIGGGEQPESKAVAKPKPKAAKKSPVVARTPIESRPLPAPETQVPLTPKIVTVPPKPVNQPATAARTPVEARPLEPQPVKKAVPQMLPGYAPPSAMMPVLPPEAPARAVETPRAPQPVAAAPLAVPKPAAPQVNDVPVTPLYEAPAKPPTGKVNDVPVAPLD